MSAGETLDKRKIDASQHFTEPPPRYSEASLVKRMEELGIGRPSTYASILQVLKDRGYVRLDKKRLMPEDKGRVVTAFLESFFARYVEYDFTAGLEEQLDRISNNELAWREVLRDFWRDFTARRRRHQGPAHRRRSSTRSTRCSAPHLFPAAADGADPRHCPTLRHRAAVAASSASSAPSSAARTIRNAATRGSSAASGAGGGAGWRHEEARRGSGDRARSDAAHRAVSAPTCSSAKPVEGEKPKRTGIAEGHARPTTSISTRALGLLSLPREVGKHPEDGEPIMAGIGRFGPYVQHGKTYANLEAGDEVLNVGLNRAVTLIAEKTLKGPRGRRFGADPGRSLGDHPDKGGPIVVKNGRYGPYVEPRRRQRHAARRQDAGDHHARRGRRADRRPRRPRRRQESAPAKRRSAPAQGRRPQNAAPKAAASKPKAPVVPQPNRKPAARPNPRPATRRHRAGRSTGSSPS